MAPNQIFVKGRSISDIVWRSHKCDTLSGKDTSLCSQDISIIVKHIQALAVSGIRISMKNSQVVCMLHDIYQ